jgi:hypothetical protein
MNSRNKSVYILAVEAKDLYLANNLIYPSTDGYVSTNKKSYCSVLDFSLDLMKYREIYEKVYRNQRFSYTEGVKEYTDRAVVVKFNYSYKDYNKSAPNVYIKAGYTYRQIAEKFKDNDVAHFEGDELIAIRLNQKCDKLLSNIPCYFEYDENEQCYVLVKEPVVLKTKAELREYLYTNGFVCNGIKFIRDKRSSGSSRVGKCLFIDENLYKQVLKWELCGLKINAGDEIDLAAFESYISLTTSSCIDTMEILPENFLVIDDYNSVFEDTVIAVEYIDGQLCAKRQRRIVSNSIFDGQSIMDESLFEKYNDKSMLLLRNRFFKSACFKGKLQKWFADNNIKNVSQLNGFTLAKDISQIKIITTPSSIKYIKFGTLQQWFDNFYTTFGIIKHEKPTPYLDGRLVQCHYQLINTLQLSENDVKQLCQPTLDYITKIREDPAVLRYHIKYPYESVEHITPLMSKNEIVFKLLGINSQFCKTKMYYDFRDDLVNAMINNLKQGHVLINGNYSTLFGNGIEMLQHSIGTFDGKSIIGIGNIHSKRFEYNKTLLASRSPHICSGNILLCTNVANDLIDKYFCLSPEIVYVNAIGENILQRLNGADYDSDSFLLTDNKILIEAAKRNYGLFDVPTCYVTAKKTKRRYTAKDKCDLDIKTSVNKIGEIVNLSQYLQSIMWNNIYKDSKKHSQLPNEEIIRKQQDLYRDICILAVMSGIEIDKAKKEFEVDTQKEISRLKSKYQKNQMIDVEVKSYQNNHEVIETEMKLKKPMFFKMITLNNGYALNSKHEYVYFHTPMDYLQKIINSFNFRTKRIKNEVIPFSDIVKPMSMYHSSRYYYYKANRIIELIKDLSRDIARQYIGYEYKTKSEKSATKTVVADLKQECVNYINNITIPDTVMYLVLKEIDNKNNYAYARLIFNTLFGTPNKKFFQMIIDKTDEIYCLDESSVGKIKLFDYSFTKRQI